VETPCCTVFYEIIIYNGVESGNLDTIYDQGFRVQGGLFLLPDTLELTARYAYIDYDDGPEITGDVRYTSWEIHLQLIIISHTITDGKFK